MAALFLDLAGTRWASYLPTPLPGVYLPDGLFLLGALICLVSGRSRRRWGFDWVLVLLYIASRGLQYGVDDVANPGAGGTFVRDMAPFLYLALVPAIGPAVGRLSEASFVRVVRWGASVMVVVILGVSTGLITPIEYGGGVPLFSSREDVDNVVLGLGVLAFGRWHGIGAKRWLQVLCFVVALGHYSRAGLLAMMLCATVAVLRERKQLDRLLPTGLLLLGGVLAGTAILLVGLPRAWVGLLPEAVARLLESDLASGTTGARVNAWTLMLQYVDRAGGWIFGFGPTAEPVISSGAVQYLSDAVDVRSPHNWFVGVIAFHGIVGLAVWSNFVIRSLCTRTSSEIAPLCRAGVAAYILAGSLGVVIESPFGSLVIAVLLARIRYGGRPEEEQPPPPSAKPEPGTVTGSRGSVSRGSSRLSVSTQRRFSVGRSDTGIRAVSKAASS